MSAAIIRGDAAHLPLPDDSVDLIITSPPYFGLRSYTDGGEHYAGQIGAEATPAEYVAALLDCTREWVRVLKPSGSLFVNLGDKYAGGGQGGNVGGHLNGGQHLNRTTKAARVIPQGFMQKSLLGLPWRYALGCVDQLGLILRAEIIWSKPNGLPESVQDRVRRSHEQLFHFTLQPRYYSAVDAIREAHAGPWKSPCGGKPAAATGPQARNGHSQWERTRAERDATARHALGKLPGSVWDIATQPLTVPAGLGIDHFAAFPMELPRRCILGWSPAGGIVLDPFGGTGTTALVADVHGRHGISLDMSADYCRLARWRVSDPRQRDRAAGRKPRPARRPRPQVPGQGMLPGMTA